MIRSALSTLAAVALVGGLAFAAEIKSGPQPGDKLPGAFHPMNITGESKGEKACLVCKNGSNPVAMVFARDCANEVTAKLLKQIDEATAKNKDAKMGSFAVFLTDDDKANAKLEEMAKKADLKNLVVAVDNPTGPEKYNVSKDADVTVVFYVKGKIVANHAFKKGELKETDLPKILANVEKIVK
jgi:hypothetical protein